MPKGAFTLLFDATPYLDHGVALFRAVKWAACDQRLKELEIAEMSQVDAPTWAEHRESAWYQFEGFPKAVQEIVRCRSIVKCNFNVGNFGTEKDVHDIEQISIDELRKVVQHLKEDESLSCFPQTAIRTTMKILSFAGLM
jgi:hypothetical protein